MLPHFQGVCTHTDAYEGKRALGIEIVDEHLQSAVAGKDSDAGLGGASIDIEKATR
jgi:hypothetical protein